MNIKCDLFKMHDWSKWSEPKREICKIDSGPVNLYYQYRYCIRCNKIQTVSDIDYWNNNE